MTSITVVGSTNLDLFAFAETLPAPGETVTGARFERYPGGKGANQAHAAAMLGAEMGVKMGTPRASVRFVGAVGADEFAQPALAGLSAAGIDLSGVVTKPDAPTGVAMISVAADGENLITVASGANHALLPADIDIGTAQAVICPLEIPIPCVAEAAKQAQQQDALFVLNAAPALAVPPALMAMVDILIVNEAEAQMLGSELMSHCSGLIIKTLGAGGAAAIHGGLEIARVQPPPVDVVDTTGAGDCFVGAFALFSARGDTVAAALKAAVTAASLACTKKGAQGCAPSLKEVEALL